MRHRSVNIFIVLLALLAAIPQATQQLWSFKSSVADQLRAGLWSALLNVSVEERSNNVIASGQHPIIANSSLEFAKASACQSGHENERNVSNESTAHQTRYSPAPFEKQRADSHHRHNEMAKVQPPPVGDAEGLLKGVVQRLREIFPVEKFDAASQLAMIIPPEQAVRPLARLTTQREAEVSGLATKVFWKGEVRVADVPARKQKDMAYIAAITARFDESGLSSLISRGDFRRCSDSSKHVDGSACGASEKSIKFIKSGRTNKFIGAKPAGRTSCPRKPGADFAVAVVKESPSFASASE